MIFDITINTLIPVIGTYLTVSDAGCAVAFKTGSEFDNMGFISQDHDAVDWCRRIFEHNWETMPQYPSGRKKIPRITTCRYRGHTSEPMKNIFFR